MFEIVNVFLLLKLNKNENIINVGYWVLSENGKNQFQARKPICPNRKNLFPQNIKKIASPLKKRPQKFPATRYFLSERLLLLKALLEENEQSDI